MMFDTQGDEKISDDAISAYHMLFECFLGEDIEWWNMSKGE